MNASTVYPNLATEPKFVQSPSLDGFQDEMVEELEESFAVVKDELERLESRLQVVEHCLSNLHPKSCLRVTNPKMAAFHHTYDPAHRTW